MLDRLNGWQRLGAVLTALWLVFAAAAAIVSLANSSGPFVEHVKGETRTIKGAPARCVSPAPKSDPSRTTITFEEALGCAPGTPIIEGTPDKHFQITADHHKFLFGTFIGFAFIPAIVAWLLIYLLIAIFIWVVAGFKRKTT